MKIRIKIDIVENRGGINLLFRKNEICEVISITNGRYVVKNKHNSLVCSLGMDGKYCEEYFEDKKIATLYPAYQWQCEECLRLNLCYWEKGHIFCPRCKTKHEVVMYKDVRGWKAKNKKFE